MASTETQALMLEAARLLLLGADYDLLAGITIKKVVDGTRVPLRSANRDFKIDELKTALMEDLLRVHPEDDLGRDDFAEYKGQLIPKESPAEELAGLAEVFFRHNMENELFRAFMAFWALNPESVEVNSRLRDMYDFWISEGRDGLNTIFAQPHRQLPLRDNWISAEDFTRAIMAMVEGLAVQESIRERLDDAGHTGNSRPDLPPMDPELPRRVMLALLASMVDAPDIPSVAEIFDRLGTDSSE